MIYDKELKYSETNGGIFVDCIFFRKYCYLSEWDIDPFTVVNMSDPSAHARRVNVNLPL